MFKNFTYYKNIIDDNQKSILLDITVLLVYLCLLLIFFVMGVDIFTTAIAPADGALYGLPSKIFTKEFSLWNPYIQTGTYTAKDINSQALYLPSILISLFFPTAFGYNLLLIIHYLIAGFFQYLYLKELGLRRMAAFIGGICFMFSGFMVAHKSHNAMINSAAFLPVIMLFIEKYFKYKRKKYLFYSSLAFSLCIFADYLAMPVYIGMVTLAYLCFKCLSSDSQINIPWSKKLLSLFKTSICLYGFAILLSAAYILPILESLRYITREKIDYTFFASYSFSFKLLPLLFFPNFFGSNASSLYSTPYFGPWNLGEMSGYMGIVTMVISVVGFIKWRKSDSQIRFWSIISIFGFVLVLGDSTPFYKIMYKIPLYNMFRVPARNWYEVNYAFSVLSGISINHLILIEEDQLKYLKSIVSKVLSALLAIVSIILISIYLLHKLIPYLDVDKLNSYGNALQRLNMFINNTQLESPAMYIPLIIIITAIVTVCFSIRFHKKNIYWLMVSLFIFIDLFSFGHFHDAGYPLYKNSVADYDNEVANFLKSNNSDLADMRVWPFEVSEKELYPQFNIAHGINTINGYGPIWLKDYKTLTLFEANGISHREKFLLRDTKLISCLSTKYVITNNEGTKSLISSIKGTKVENNLYLGNVNRVVIKDLKQNGWNLFSPYSINEGIVVLKSKTGDDFSLIQYNFGLKPNTDYKISFEARTDSNEEQLLIVDFATDANYDGAEQEEHFDNSILSSEFKTLSITFNSGANVPDNTNLRFFTFSKSPIEVRNISLKEVDASTLYWGQQNNSSSINIYNKVYETKEGIAVYENLNYLPRARFVKNVLKVSNFEEVSQILNEDITFNPAKTALLEDFDYNCEFDDGMVVETNYSNDSIELKVKTGKESFLVLSDSWYPGWKAYIDGKQTEIYKTYGILRGIYIEGEGIHQIKLIFRPMSFYIGLLISIIVLISILVYIAYDRRKI